MRWFMQIFVMLSDLLVWSLMIYVPYAAHFNLVSILLSIGVYSAWKKTGGWEAWKPSTIRDFLHNAKEVGL